MTEERNIGLMPSVTEEVDATGGYPEVTEEWDNGLIPFVTKKCRCHQVLSGNYPRVNRGANDIRARRGRHNGMDPAAIQEQETRYEI